jgi:membrane protease YdiL (CAAX protease family)
MLVNSSNQQRKEWLNGWRLAIALPLWVIVGFGAAQLLLVALLSLLQRVGVPLQSVNGSVFQFIVAALVYVLSIVLVIGLPWWIQKRSTTKQDIGLTRLPSLMDLGMVPVGFVVYLLASMVLAYFAALLIPNFNAAQAQQTGFTNLAYYYEYLLAFVTLIVVAPIAEEILFRGYLYGKLRKAMPTWVAMLVTSVLFGAVHGQWNVAVDVFALSMVACSLREITGSIWTGMLLHMLKNGLAFYVLFINPVLLHTIGG